jgi:hypothetical protein
MMPPFDLSDQLPVRPIVDVGAWRLQCFRAGLIICLLHSMRKMNSNSKELY